MSKDKLVKVKWNDEKKAYEIEFARLVIYCRNPDDAFSRVIRQAANDYCSQLPREIVFQCMTWYKSQEK